MLPTITLARSSLQLSAVALGTGAFGTGVTDDVADAVYEAFRAGGGNTFDTAHCYCFWVPGQESGSSERSLGACIKRHGDGGKVNIVTKGGHPGQEPDYARPDHYMSPERVALDIEESLQRLGVDSIDLYFLHRDDSRMSVDEIIDMMGEHVAAGRVRSLGASNWRTARLEEANAWAADHGKPGFVASQPEFNLAWQNRVVEETDPAVRYLRDADVAWHSASGLPVICYTPTAGGYFASNGERAQGGYDNATSRRRLERVNKLAAELGATPNQIALAWVMNQPFPAIPILGTANVAHLNDGMGAASLKLTPEQLVWLTGEE